MTDLNMQAMNIKRNETHNNPHTGHDSNCSIRPQLAMVAEQQTKLCLTSYGIYSARVHQGIDCPNCVIQIQNAITECPHIIKSGELWVVFPSFKQDGVNILSPGSPIQVTLFWSL